MWVGRGHMASSVVFTGRERARDLYELLPMNVFFSPSLSLSPSTVRVRVNSNNNGHPVIMSFMSAQQ